MMRKCYIDSLALSKSTNELLNRMFKHTAKAVKIDYLLTNT